jgi:GT2 family glycosyltransferase
MLHRTLDLLKTTDITQHAQELSEEGPSGRVCRIAVAAGGTGFSGWYRLKLFSPASLLQRVSIEALDERAERIFAFESLTAGRHFSGYLFSGTSVASIGIRAYLDAVQQSDLIATLRPISLVEYIWCSLRRNIFRRPLTFLKYFFRPLVPFAIAFEFPEPPRFADQDALYAWWISERESAAYARLMNAVRVTTSERPSVAIIMAACDPQPVSIRKAIESVLRQTTANWELCIAADASVSPEISQMLSDAARSNSQIKLRFREQRGGTAVTSNDALGLASSPFVARLDQGDVLAPFSVEAVASFLGQKANTKLLYSDEDKIDQNGNRVLPFLKPEFSPELLNSFNYFGHLTAYRSDSIRGIGGWQGDFDSSGDYDLNLRFIDVIDESEVGHVPMILYHKRAASEPPALVGWHDIEAGQHALRQHLARRLIKARVDIVAANAMYRVRYELPCPQPKVSIIIPFRDKAALLRRCVSSIQEKTTYTNYEIVLVDNGSVEESTLELLNNYKDNAVIHILHQRGIFNYSALNNVAAAYSRADYLCLMNNDVVVITPNWLEDMVGYASQPGVGCVGAKLYYANGTIQHAGIVLGLGGVSGHVFLNRARDDPGYFGRLLVASNYSAVTGACLLVRRSIYMEVGGLDDMELSVGFNDIDFCIKVKSAGYRNVMTPFAELVHYESSSRGRDDTREKTLRLRREVEVMKERHGTLLESDPYYSPHLTLTGDDFSLKAD